MPFIHHRSAKCGQAAEHDSRVAGSALKSEVCGLSVSYVKLGNEVAFNNGASRLGNRCESIDDSIFCMSIL